MKRNKTSQQERNRIKIEQLENTIKDTEVKLIVRAVVHNLVHLCEFVNAFKELYPLVQ